MKSSPKSSSLTTLSLVLVSLFHGLPQLQAEQWTIVGSSPVSPNTVNFSNYNWNDPANWSPASIPNGVDASALFDINILSNGPAGPQLQGTQQINLSVPTTVGNLTLGDANTAAAGFNGNGFYNIVNGTAGSLTFQKTTGSATLQKTANSGTTDTIAASVILNSDLAADIRPSGTIMISGLVSGTGNLVRSGSVSGAVASNGGTLGLSNNNNSYTGSTVIEHGTLNAVLNGDVLVSTNSVLGNSATPIVFGTSTLAPATASQNTQTLRLSAGSDSANYTFSRGLDFSTVTQAGAGGTTLAFQGDAAGGLNTNRLTVSGNIVVGGSRGAGFQALRSGVTMDITGNITGSITAGAITFNTFPPNPSVDGRGSGTIRLSNVARSYDTVQHLGSGTLIIEGSVGALNTDSPVGRRAVGLSNGSGIGNIVGGGNFSGGNATNDTSPDSTRALYLESAGTSYARIMAPGGGTSTTPVAGGYGSVQVINGFMIGGLNTTGTTTFSGPINPGTPAVGSSTSNPITTAINLALIAQTGGTVEFTGGITDGTTTTNTHTRVTINQFRNNPHLDGTNNAGTTVVSDGNADTLANNGANYTADRLVGTATGGTVVLSTGAGTWDGTTEVLGGTFRVNSSVAGNTLTVASGATLAGTGTINAGTSGSVLQVNGTLAPGASPGILTSNKPVSFNVGSTFATEINGTTAGSQYDQLAANSTLSINNTSVFSLTLGYAPTPGEQFTLISLASGSISGTFAGLPEGGIRTATFGGTPYDFSASYVGGNGNDFVLTAVPEPSALVCLMGTVALLSGSRRRRSVVTV